MLGKGTFFIPDSRQAADLKSGGPRYLGAGYHGVLAWRRRILPYSGLTSSAGNRKSHVSVVSRDRVG